MSALSTFSARKKTATVPTVRSVLKLPVTRRGFDIEPYRGNGAFAGSTSVKLLEFANLDNQRLYCWYPRRQSARDFCSDNNIRGEPQKPNLFTGTNATVTIYYPMKRYAFVTKTVQIQGVASYTRVLETIEKYLNDAVEFWVRKGAGTKFGTTTRVPTRASHRDSQKTDGFMDCVSHLMVTRGGGYNKIFVRTLQ